MTEPASATSLPYIHPLPIYVTAFCEGAIVLVIEILGARAIAPFFGTSLQVWTSQITATLLFLALGYGLGGLLAKITGRWTLPTLFLIAGIWLAMYPLIRTPVLEMSSSNFGVALGSLFSACLLFGIPLMMLGAVSPVLINLLNRAKQGAGAAAGRLFFTNTMGGLAGGWITALFLIPHTSLRVCLLITGIVLIALAVIWSILPRSAMTPFAIILLLGAIALAYLNHPPRSYITKRGDRFELLYSQQSGIGLLQVLDYSDHRELLIDGVNQGDMTVEGGYAWRDYIHDLVLLSTSHNPEAKTALQLGLGAGMLPKALSKRGMSVTAVDIEPQMIEIARKQFDLPKEVNVVLSDARAFLRHDTNKYDLIFLDTFASESTAWHMLTSEAMHDIQRHLNPGGRLLINTVAYADPKRPGLDGIESSVLSAFPQAEVYPQDNPGNDPSTLINITIVAGENLHAQMITPKGENAMQMLARLIRDSRPATARVATPTDERNRLDYEQAPLRINWRTEIWKYLDSSLLWD